MKLNKITVLTGLVLLISSQAYSHGYVENPASRGLLCKNGANKNCGSRAQYEPQSIEQVDDFFNLGTLDNNMGSAGVSGFEPLDEQEQSRWAKTVVKPDEPLKIKWLFTANHKSKHFKFYITKPNWDPNKLLQRSDFEDTPLNCYDPQPAWVAPNQPPKDGLTFTCTMPERSGYQIIMAEWDVEDTRMSFYNLLDLDFTNDKPAGIVILPNGTSDEGGSEQSGVPKYNINNSYPTPGTEVIFENKIYQNKWYINPGESPKQNNGWEYIRDYEEQLDPTDPFSVEATKFTINPLDIKQGDKIILQVAEKSKEMVDYPLLTIPEGMSTNDFFIELTSIINKLSSEKLDNQIIAGVKNNNNNVVPNDNSLYIYQTADKPYDQISFYYQQASHNIKNMLHLMDFNNEYTLDTDGKLHINAKIMSHSSAKANISIVLQDSTGKEIYRKSDIEILPTYTYDLALSIENVSSGSYKLIISSNIAGAKAWQQTMDIEVKSSGSSEDTPTLDKNIDITIESNTPYYQIKADDSVIPRTWSSNIGPTNLVNYQITIATWNKTLQASDNDNSVYTKCPLPTNNQTSITYLVNGSLDSVSCKIK